MLPTHKGDGRDKVWEKGPFVQLRRHFAPLESYRLDFRGAALQDSILHELSSGKLAMHKQVFPLLPLRA